MRLMFVTRNINSAGGVERMITSVMKALAERGHEISLLTWDSRQAEAFFPTPPVVKWHRLNMGDPAKKANLGLVAARFPIVRGLIKRVAPDIIICFQAGSFRSMQLYTLGLGIPLVAAERTSPRLHDYLNSQRLRFVEHQCFRFADRILIQFERFREFYPEYLRPRMVTISNPVTPAAFLACPDQAGAQGRWRLLSVGRLGYQKNFDVLIDAFARLAPVFPDWDLHIVGEGEDRQKLEASAAARSELHNRVHLPGKTSAVDREYASAHLFCLPSRWEGFPNALAEALAHGLPSVGFVGCDGVPDLIIPGKNGALAQGNCNAGALADALAPLMADAAARAVLGDGAVSSVAAYRPETVFDRWETVLGECVTKSLERGQPHGTAASRQ